MKKSFSENNSYKIVALLITLILWVIILGSKDATITKFIDINFILPKNMAQVNQLPTKVAYRVTGPRLALKRFSENQEPLTIDLSSAQEGFSTIRIHHDSINIPVGVRVLSVNPSSLIPKLEKVLTVNLPVEVVFKGSLPAGKRLGHVSIRPESWEVSAPRSLLEGVKRIRTEPFELSEVKSSLSKELKLNFDEIGLEQKKDFKVLVEVSIR